MANKIIYDSSTTGHHSEYISHLVEHIVDLKSEDTFYFVVSEEFLVKFPEIVEKSKNCISVIWEFIPFIRVQELHKLSLIKRSFSELALVTEYSRQLKVTEVILLYFNVFQLALIFKRVSFNIKGILFLQFYWMPRDSWMNKLKYYRKYYITKLYTLNSKISTIFILNDTATADYLNAKFNTGIFRMLPDPIPIFEEEEGFDIYDYYEIPKDKKILLHPGSIDPRKGTYEIIDSVKLLKQKEKTEYAILIVGKAKSDIDSIINQKLNELEDIKFCIVYHNDFVSNERLKSLFLQSYAILMPYKNVEASSGIMGHAILAKKIILAPNSGLIGEMIKNFKLGILIDKPISEDIVKGIEMLNDYESDKLLASLFVEQHKPNFFSNTLLDRTSNDLSL